MFSSKSTLLRALRNMGFEPIESESGSLSVSDMYGRTGRQDVEIKVPNMQLGTKSELGFRWNQDSLSYDMTADVWEIDRAMRHKGIYPDTHGFTEWMSAQYGIAALEEQGHSVDSSAIEFLPNGEITVQATVSQY